MGRESTQKGRREGLQGSVQPRSLGLDGQSEQQEAQGCRWGGTFGAATGSWYHFPLPLACRPRAWHVSRTRKEAVDREHAGSLAVGAEGRLPRRKAPPAAPHWLQGCRSLSARGLEQAALMLGPA